MYFFPFFFPLPDSPGKNTAYRLFVCRFENQFNKINSKIVSFTHRNQFLKETDFNKLEIF